MIGGARAAASSAGLASVAVGVVIALWVGVRGEAQ